MMTARPLPYEWRDPLQYGMDGDDVAAWQVVLKSDGRELGPSGADGKFRSLTQNATVAWQRARGLSGGHLGKVTAATRALIGTLAEPPTLRHLDWPNLPYVEAVNWQRDVGPQVKRNIVIHTMEVAEAATSAEWCAAFFAGKKGPAPKASAHACVDDDSIVQCVPWDRIAWACGGLNKQGIHIELAGFARQSLAEWRDDYSRRMLDRAAWLVAKLSNQHDIPAEFCAADDLVAREPGVTTHWEGTKAFGKSTHTDPGPHFPMADFLRRVRDYIG
jgi:hypothetical protein